MKLPRIRRIGAKLEDTAVAIGHSCVALQLDIYVRLGVLSTVPPMSVAACVAKLEVCDRLIGSISIRVRVLESRRGKHASFG